MQANLLLQREMNNKVECGSVRSPYSAFHFHSHIEFYIVKSGKIEIMINDQKKVLTGGEISVAFSYDAHGYRSVEESEAIYLIIPLDRCQDVLPELSSKRLASPFINDKKTFEILRAAAEGIMESKNEISKKGHIYTILGAIFDRMTDKDQSSPAQHSFSADILIHISKNFKEELTLPSLAREFGFSPSYLSRSFRETFGISFVRYLTTLRLREAVLLLRSGKMSVTECALESGFGSMRSFYRAFFDEFGCTPKEYLKGAARRG